MDLTREYNHCKFLLKVVGLWPDQNKYRRFATWVLYYIYNVSYFVPVIGYCVLHWEDGISEVMSDVMVIALQAAYFTGYSVIFFSAPKIKSLLRFLKDINDTVKDENERKILNDYTELSYKLSVVFSAAFLSIAVFAYMLPLDSLVLNMFFHTSNSTPIKLVIVPADYMFFDQIEYYILSNTHMAIFTTMNVVMLSGFGTLFILTIEQTCALFAVTSFRLSSIVQHQEVEQSCAKVSVHRRRETMKKVVSLHSQSIKAYFLLEKVFCWSIAVFQCLCVSMLTFSLFYLSRVHAPLVRHVITILITVSFVNFMFVFNWFGQQIINHTQDIFDAAYNSHWDSLSPKERKYISIIMCRSTNPYFLTGGKVVPLSMETFARLMKLSVSYYTVLKTVTM